MLEYVVVGLIGLFLLINILRVVGSKMLVAGRMATMRSIEKERKSRLITMIHRQKGRGMLAMLMSKFIDIEDSMSILEAIRKTPSGTDIDFVVHTPGGLVLASSQIARALAKHDGKVRVIVPHYAMSGGTLLALAADEIVIDENGVMGPVDPQLGKMPAASLVKLIDNKDPNEIDDSTHIMIDLAKKSLVQMRETVEELLISKGRSEDDAQDIAEQLVNGTWTHDYPLTYEFFQQRNFNISTDVPAKVYDLMKMFPNLTDAMPTVEYIPLPRKRKEAKANLNLW